MHVKFAAQLGLSTHFAKGNWHLLNKHGATLDILFESADASVAPPKIAAMATNDAAL